MKSTGAPTTYFHHLASLLPSKKRVGPRRDRLLSPPRTFGGSVTPVLPQITANRVGPQVLTEVTEPQLRFIVEHLLERAEGKAQISTMKPLVNTDLPPQNIRLHGQYQRQASDRRSARECYTRRRMGDNMVGSWPIFRLMNTYESLSAWQHAHRLCLEIFRATSGGNYAQEHVISELRWVALRTPATLAKASAFRGDRWFGRYVSFAFGYAVETEYLLSLATQLEYLPGRAISGLREGVLETAGEIERLLLETGNGE